MKCKLAWSTDPWPFVLLNGRSLTGGCFCWSSRVDSSDRDPLISFSFHCQTTDRSISSGYGLVTRRRLCPSLGWSFRFQRFRSLSLKRSVPLSLYRIYLKHTQIYLERNTAVVLSHIHTPYDRCVPCLTIKHLFLVAHWTVLLLYSHYSTLFSVLQ